MFNTKIAGLGYYVPERIVPNSELENLMDTTDAWIQERTGIQERRYGKLHQETTTTMGARAAEIAIERAGIQKEDIDFIIFATLSPDYFFPGCGVPKKCLPLMSAINAPVLFMVCPLQINSSRPASIKIFYWLDQKCNRWDWIILLEAATYRSSLVMAQERSCFSQVWRKTPAYFPLIFTQMVPMQT